MSEIEFIKWAVYAVLGVAMWFLKRTIDKTENDISTLKADLSSVKSEYLHKSDFKEFKIELRGMFEDLRGDIRSLQHSSLVCPKD